MAQQEEGGWPLGLQPLNVRVGLVRNRELNGSLSFGTLLTDSPTSSPDSSSAVDSDTQSTGSFFRDKGITLGSLIGISNILEFSRRSTRGRIHEPIKEKKVSYKSKAWLFPLCSRLSTDAVSINNTPSLGHFLEAERQAASIYRRNKSTEIYGTDSMSHVLSAADTNTFYVECNVAPPLSSSHLGQDGERSFGEGLLQDDAYGTTSLFSCLCGNLTH